MRVTFQGFKGHVECRFDCPACGGKRRKRSFITEHTVNPFNTNPDGLPKSASQVSREAQAAARLERDQFLTSPLCRRCEDALSYLGRRDLAETRRASPISSADGRSP